MPLKFWKKEKPPKGKEEEGEEAGEAPPAKKEAPKPAAKEAAEPKKEAPPPAPAPAVRPEAFEATAQEVHAGLVELGLTIPATREIFAKRAGLYPGGAGAFHKDYGSEPYRAATRVLADWLGLRAPHDFDPEKLLAEANPRLSSFGLSVELGDLSWLDQELGLRKARLRLADSEKVVRFKDPRDFVKGINELIAGRKVAFLELETWSDDFAFLLVRDPKWDRLAETELVVVKAPQTAVGGECGECGAKVGKYWNDCLACGAVFG